MGGEVTRSRWATSALPVTLATAPPGIFFALFVVPRLRSWGATPSELAQEWPGDELVPRPGFVWTNAVTINGSAESVWPWVNQLGQGRGGLYSYDWLENAIGAGVHSLAEVREELQRHLTLGERVIRMTRYAPFNPVARYDPGRALVLGGVNDSDSQLRQGRPSSTWAFIVQPLNDTTSRLIVRSRACGVIARLQGPIQFVMQRKMMLGIKQRAEGTWAPSAADVFIPLSWFAAASATATLLARASRAREHRARQAAQAGLAGITVQVLLFWDVFDRSTAAPPVTKPSAGRRSLRRRP